jgi:hypothetical protein
MRARTKRKSVFDQRLGIATVEPRWLPAQLLRFTSQIKLQYGPARFARVLAFMMARTKRKSVFDQRLGMRP